MSTQSAAVVGNAQFRYKAHEDWAQLPPGWSFGEVAGVATDSRDRVFVYSRSEHPLTVFDRDGKFIGSWGEGQMVRPHGIHIGPDDAVYVTDDCDHSVRKFSPDGKLLLTLGTRGVASDTGCEGSDYRTIQRAAGPFNQPTNVALARDGSIYVTDGYGNARVHQFSSDGRLIRSWGEPGAGPGQFHLPHGVAVDRDGRVYVADRENSRVQIFTVDGKFITEWRAVSRPTEVFIAVRSGDDDLVFISEIGYRCGLFPGMTAPPNPPGSCVSIWTRDGKLLCRWGGGPDPCATGDFFAAHDIWADSRGDIYVERGHTLGWRQSWDRFTQVSHSSEVRQTTRLNESGSGRNRRTLFYPGMAKESAAPDYRLMLRAKSEWIDCSGPVSAGYSVRALRTASVRVGQPDRGGWTPQRAAGGWGEVLQRSQRAGRVAKCNQPSHRCSAGVTSSPRSSSPAFAGISDSR